MKKRILILSSALLVGAVAYASLTFAPKHTSVLNASGTIEARTIHVGSKIGGRIESVLVHEGDRVEAGQTLILLDSAELSAALEQATARVAQARASLEKLQNGYQPEEVEEARAAADAARAEFQDSRHGYTKEEIAQAAAERDRAQSDADNAHITYVRYEDLFRDEAISRQQRDDAQARWEQARATLDKASQHLTQLQGGYRVEVVSAAESRLRQAQAVAMKKERGYRSEEIAAARAELAQAVADRKKMEVRLAEHKIVSPAAAVIEVMDVRPGDLVRENDPVATLLERGQLYVRVYVPETRLGLAHPGQPAEVTVDSFHGQKFAAHVEQVNQKAEYLPRNVETENARSHQFFGLKLAIDDPGSGLRAGMAADVTLQLEGN